MDTFSSYHPVVNFIYFLMVIGSSMFFMHPVFLGISLCAAMLYSFCLQREKAFRRILFGIFPVMLLMAVINPVFSHEGATMLFYLKDGNPVTLESIVYGIVSGLMLAAVLLWCSCFHLVMTSDKVMYLFGKTIPAFSLLFSMTLRFVPRFTNQVRKVSQSQRCIGRDVSSGKWSERALHGMKILSSTTTWALENSVETADSMKSRGYGLRGRTNYSIYRFTKRDAGMLLFLGMFFLAFLYAAAKQWVSILYFPVFKMNENIPAAVLVYLGYGILCFLPVLLNGKEAVRWRYLRSKI